MRLSEYSDDELAPLLPGLDRTDPPRRVKYEPLASGNPFSRAFTANRIPIVDGMRVFTNNLDVGTIDLSDAEWEWHEPEQRYHLWFQVNVDTRYDGRSCNMRYAQSDDRVSTRHPSNGRSA